MGVNNACSCGAGMGVHQLWCTLLNLEPVASASFNPLALYELTESRGLIEQMVAQVNEHVERAGFEEVVRLLRERGWLVASPKSASDLQQLKLVANAFPSEFTRKGESDEQERAAAWQLYDAVRAFLELINNGMREQFNEPQE